MLLHWLFQIISRNSRFWYDEESLSVQQQCQFVTQTSYTTKENQLCRMQVGGPRPGVGGPSAYSLLQLVSLGI